MTELEKFLNDVKERADKATKGKLECTDNYLEIEGLDGKRGTILAEFFSENPCYGDSSNDTHFYVSAKTDIEKLLKIVGVMEEALKKCSDGCQSLLLKQSTQEYYALTMHYSGEALSEADKIAGEK